MTPRRPDRGFDRYDDDTWREARDTGFRPDPPEIALGGTTPEEDLKIARQMMVQRTQRLRGRRLTKQEIKDAHSLIKASPAPCIAPKICLARAAVLDPRQDPNRPIGQTSRVTVNRRVDILENERKHKRITAAAFRSGRRMQEIFEECQLGGASNWNAGSRVDTTVAKESAIERKMIHAEYMKKYLPWMCSVLGQKDAEIVRQILGENRRYGDVDLNGEQVRGRLARAVFEHAQLRNPMLLPDRKPDVSYIAHRFRDALETLATTRSEPPGRRRGDRGDSH